ncbi:hypothetical protein L6164_013316 [Bauhinia variegata]|nr:hypothetical protein L6164_013316 [Bauhinia variegata]
MPKTGILWEGRPAVPLEIILSITDPNHAAKDRPEYCRRSAFGSGRVYYRPEFCCWVLGRTKAGASHSVVQVSFLFLILSNSRSELLKFICLVADQPSHTILVEYPHSGHLSFSL